MEQPEDDPEIPPEERRALLAISHGAVVTSGGIAVQRALTTATEFILAQALGPAVYGVYAFAWRITHLLFRFVNFGGVQTLQRFVPADEGDPERRRRTAGLAYATTVVVGVVLAAGLLVGAERINRATVSDPLFPPAVGMFGALLVIVGIIKVHAALLRAVGSARGEVLFNRVLRRRAASLRLSWLCGRATPWSVSQGPSSSGRPFWQPRGCRRRCRSPEYGRRSGGGGPSCRGFSTTPPQSLSAPSGSSSRVGSTW